MASLLQDLEAGRVESPLRPWGCPLGLTEALKGSSFYSSILCEEQHLSAVEHPFGFPLSFLFFFLFASFFLLFFL